MLVAVAHLVAVAERHALGGQEGAEERADPEDLVADLLEELADLPLGHGAQAQPAHVDQLPQVDGHDQVGLHRVREDEARVLGRHLGLEQLPVEVEVVVDRALELAGQVIGQVALGDRVRDGVVVALLEADVALRLLVEGGPGPMAHQLMARASGSRR